MAGLTVLVLIAGLVGLIGIGSLLGRFAIGTLADRLGRPRSLVVVMASVGASMLLWLAAPALPAGPALVVFAVWMGLSYGGVVALMPALCMDFFGARAVSSIIGALYSAAAIGNLAGPWIAGRVFDSTGSYAPVILGCALLSAASAWAAWQAAQSARSMNVHVTSPQR
jgi:predicted MFS family arabinose efflux permease